jgi:hypothetical protein
MHAIALNGNLIELPLERPLLYPNKFAFLTSSSIYLLNLKVWASNGFSYTRGMSYDLALRFGMGSNDIYCRY